MNGLQRAALACFVLGVGTLVYAGVRGELRVGLFLVVPFVVGTGPWGALGMLLLMAAAVLGVLGAARGMGAMAPDEAGERRVERRSGGVVLLGPIPIVWGSDRRSLAWMIAAGVALLVLAFWLTRATR